MGEPLLEVDGLSIAFAVGGAWRPALSDVSFTVAPGEVVGLVGESGSGKSTVLFAVMSYLAANARVDGGAARFRGQDLLRLGRPALDRIRGRHIAMVYQDPGTALNPSMRIGPQIVETVRRHLGPDGSAARDRALASLERVHLDNPPQVFEAYPHQLSGGQKQRAMIALAVSAGPDLLLMDEPTTALDVVVQAHILTLVRELARETGTGILFVTHDLGVVGQIADRVGVLYAGELMEVGPVANILYRPRNPYTRGLIAAMPRLQDRALPRSIPGVIAREPDRFGHCVFADRCPATAAPCRSTRPALATIEAGWRSRCHFANTPERLTREGGEDEPPAGVGASAAPLLEVRDLAVTYRRRRRLVDLIQGRDASGVAAVRDVSFDLGSEETVAVVGESGSGKTTLARAILRLVPAAAGRIRFSGADVLALTRAQLRDYRRGMQIVFQNPTSSLNPRKSIGDLVARPLRLAGRSGAAARDATAAMLAQVGLDDSYLSRLPGQLSGGEKQRVAIARAFITEPRLVILDEPTTALDVSVQATVLRLLARLKAQHRCAYLLISHDLAVVRQLADRVIVMRGGEICETGPTAQVFAAPTHRYTRELLAAVPTLKDATALAS